jgi:hypothetical protein
MLRTLLNRMASYLIEAAWEIGKSHCVYSPDDVTCMLFLSDLRKRD